MGLEPKTFRFAFWSANHYTTRPVGGTSFVLWWKGFCRSKDAKRQCGLVKSAEAEELGLEVQLYFWTSFIFLRRLLALTYWDLKQCVCIVQKRFVCFSRLCSNINSKGMRLNFTVHDNICTQHYKHISSHDTWKCVRLCCDCERISSVSFNEDKWNSVMNRILVFWSTFVSGTKPRFLQVTCGVCVQGVETIKVVCMK